MSIYFPQSTGLDGDHAANATTLAVLDVAELDPSGQLALDGIGQTFAYTLADLSGSTVTIDPPLPEDVADATTVTALDPQGKPLGVLKAFVSLHDGEPPVDCPIDGTVREKFTEGEGMVGQMVLLDDLRNVVGLPYQLPYIDPSMLLTSEVETSTTPSIPNGTFEQPDPLGLRPFAKWRSYASAGNARLVPITDGGQIAGSTSAGAELDGTNSWLFIISDDLVPVHGGDEIRARVTVSADRDMTYVAHSLGYRPARMILMTSTDASDPADVLVGTSAWTALGPAPDTLLADEETILSGSALVPDGHQWMRLALRFGHPGDGLGPATPIADEFARIDLQVTPEAVYLDSTRTFVNGIPLDDYIRAVLAGDTFTFTATDSTSYEGGGASWGTERMYQGYTGARGQRKSAALFDQAAIATAKGGGTFTEGYWLLRVRYAPAAADSLRIGYHEATTLPSTYGALSGKHEAVQTANPAHDGSVVRIPVSAATLAALNAGTFGGLLIGPGLSTADKYVYQLDGVGMDSPPQLELKVA